MRIWYVLPVFPAPSETFVTTEIRALRDLGARVSVHTFAATPRGGDRLLRERNLELRVEHGGLRTVLLGLAGARFHPRALVRLLGYVWRSGRHRPRQLLASLAWIPGALAIFRRARRERPDVIHLFWGHYPSLLGRLVLDFLPDVVLTTSLGAYDLTLDYAGSRPVAKEAGMVRTYAATNVPALVRWGVPEDRIVVEYHGIDLSRVPRQQPDVVRGRVVSAGRLIPDKGMDDVLRVFHRVLKARPDATLRILGDGPDRDRLEALANEIGIAGAVEFEGFVPHGRVFSALAEAEVLLFLTRHEAERLPNVVKEAMACGCTCVVNDSPGMNELLVDGEHGFVLPPGDLDRAEETVVRVLQEGAEQRRGRLDRARRHVHRHFDPDVIASRLLERWEAMVRVRGSSVSEGGRRVPG